jgi:hypothetical protein
MCKLMISEPLIYRVYTISFYLAWLRCANWQFMNHWYTGYMFREITFYLACLTCANWQFLKHWYISYIFEVQYHFIWHMFGVKSHFSWHVWDVRTDDFWPRAVSYAAPRILIKSWYSWWTPNKVLIDSMTSMWTPSGVYQDFCRDYFLQGCKAVSSLQLKQ